MSLRSFLKRAVMKCVVIFSLILAYANAQNNRFPEGFKFGVATASYQVEGAWNLNGKGVNIWDNLTHTRPELIADRSTGDIACDAYHKTQEDVQLLKNQGVDFYRFSISWSRILPTGYADVINEDGLRYYNELIDELLANDITPFVTMYHWDLPQPLQDIDGWPNRDLADIFADFADVLYSSFGDRVKDWITFNEPSQICEAGYSTAGKAPAYTLAGIGGYLCTHTLLIAHGKAYRLYNEKYRDVQQGRVGITIDTAWYEPLSDSEEDIEAAERSMQMNYGWYAHPIFSEAGDYPPIMRERVDAMSEKEGFETSRLPTFTEEEIELIRGSADFLGLNHYSSALCTPIPEEWELTGPSQWVDVGVLCVPDPEWEVAASTWLYVVPWGLRNLLNWIKNEYNNPEVIITENGFSDTGGLNDCRRVNYYNSYITSVVDALIEDGCNITGYTAWSFMDNFEWLMGYTERFGIHFVDFEDPDRPRTPKMSSYVFKNIIETREVNWDYTPEGFEACDWSRKTN